MVRLIQCPKGHYYDSEKGKQCPVCKEIAESISKKTQQEEGSLTKDVYNSLNHSVADGDSVRRKSEEIDTERTERRMNNADVVHTTDSRIPVGRAVGWLMPMTGERQGIEYRLLDGHNRIGHGRGMTVLMNFTPNSNVYYGDLVYDKRSGDFFIVAGTQGELFCNGERIANARQIHTGDTLSIGGRDCVFVAFCNQQRNWN